jgi:hypothetical protein
MLLEKEEDKRIEREERLKEICENIAARTLQKHWRDHLERRKTNKGKGATRRRRRFNFQDVSRKA